MFTIFPQYSHLNLRKIWRLRAFDPYKFITPSMVIKILPTAKAGDIAPGMKSRLSVQLISKHTDGSGYLYLGLH